MNTLRLYLCSVSGDMDGERAVLHEKVFPQLQKRAEGVGLTLKVIDPAGAATEWSLEQRFREIDACRPFFVALLGERYGDPPVLVPQALRDEHLWLASDPGRSTFELEILHGVLNDPGAAWQSFFYLRDPRFLAQIPESRRWRLLSENPKAAARLAGLKEKIRLSGRPLFMDYPCTWSETLERTVQLDDFADRVLGELWGAVLEEADLTVAEGLAHLRKTPADVPVLESDPLQEMRDEAERVLGDLLDGDLNATVLAAPPPAPAPPPPDLEASEDLKDGTLPTGGLAVIAPPPPAAAPAQALPPAAPKPGAAIFWGLALVVAAAVVLCLVLWLSRS